MAVVVSISANLSASAFQDTHSPEGTGIDYTRLKALNNKTLRLSTPLKPNSLFFYVSLSRRTIRHDKDYASN